MSNPCLSFVSYKGCGVYFDTICVAKGLSPADSKVTFNECGFLRNALLIPLAV